MSQDWSSRPSSAEWLSITRYAQVYGVDRVTVYKWLRAGFLVTYESPDGIRRIKHQPPREGNTRVGDDPAQH